MDCYNFISRREHWVLCGSKDVYITFTGMVSRNVYRNLFYIWWLYFELCINTYALFLWLNYKTSSWCLLGAKNKIKSSKNTCLQNLNLMFCNSVGFEPHLHGYHWFLFLYSYLPLLFFKINFIILSNMYCIHKYITRWSDSFTLAKANTTLLFLLFS